MEKIRANSDTRLIVKPHAHEANSVNVNVIMTAEPTTTASRQPSVSRIRIITEIVAKASFWISFFALSSAVLP